MSGTAVLSPHGTYRYLLTREWESQLGMPDRCMTFVMLNPSTADAEKDDQTIRRCLGYARRDGCTSLKVVNLFAYRATDPDDLIAAADSGVDVVGPENLRYVDEALRTGKVVVAWGGTASVCPPTPVADLLAHWSQPMWCLGLTSDGHPRHPSRGGYRELVRWTRGPS